ncbi:MAG TPA: HU family DNA-binding protein [Candidatus Glassbacteria bacterium]|nr:HU family DNA-binding protein [Candidatus Glassbacteria bacterium]
MNENFNRDWFIREVAKRYNAQRTHKDDMEIYLREFKEIFEIIQDVIYDIVENRDTLTLYELFKIKVQKRKAKNIYNFQTKEINIVPANEKVVIIPSTILNELLAETGEQED